MTNIELNPLFFKFLGRYYSEDFVFWLGSEATPGKAAAFERLADILEPLYTLLQLGVASSAAFSIEATIWSNSASGSLNSRGFRKRASLR